MTDRTFAESAVRIWRSLNPGAPPNGTETLKETTKSAVYRLIGTGVIAKRTRQSTAALERTIYESVLPQLPVTALRYHGSAPDESDPGFSWLFLEDTTGKQWVREHSFQNILISRWIALLHTSAVQIGKLSLLPTYNSDYFLSQLRGARAAIAEILNNPAFDCDTLRTTLEYCDRMESQWTLLEKSCAGIPLTLVHGDIKPKNVHFQGDSVYVLDWECAGWGLLTPDLCCLDLTSYRDTAQRVWPNLTSEILRQWGAVGLIFRSVCAILWASSFMRHGQVSKGVRRLPSCLSEFQKGVNFLELG